MHFSADELHYEFIIGKLAARSGCRGSIPSRSQMLDSGGSLVAQMLEQDVGEFAAGAAAERIQDRLVLAHGLAPALPLAGEIGGVADTADPPGETGIGGAQGLITCGRDDALMDALVDREIAVHVA